MLVRGVLLRLLTRSLGTTVLAMACLLGAGLPAAHADARRTATLGTPSGAAIASTCDREAVLVGLRVATEADYVVSVAGLCEDLGGAVSAAPAIEASSGWRAATSWCALADVANGIHGSAGDVVHAVGTGCRELDDGAPVGGWGGASTGPLDCRPGSVLRGIEGTVADHRGRAAVHSLTGVCGPDLGKRAAAQRCQQDGWQALAGSDGTIFADGGECVSHAAEGGALIDRASLLQCQQQVEDAGLTPSADVVYLVGTPGHDDLSRVGPGTDVLCGFAGNDSVGSLAGDDVFLGGPGIDSIDRMSGGTFLGGPGNSIVHTLSGGVVRGGADSDSVGSMSGGTFDGGDGRDVVDELFGTTGVFDGGAGQDVVNFLFDGTFNGGDDIDWVVEMYGGTFNGGAGADGVEEMYSGTFNGGAGDDRVRNKSGGTCTDVSNC